MNENLVASAHRLFAARGIDGVSVAQIAEAAGMSKANVLHHHRSKAHLYATCLGEVGARLDHCLDEIDDRGDPAGELAAALDRWADEYPDDVRLLAFGLLRLREHPGPWVLAGPVTRMVDQLGGDPQVAGKQVNDLLGHVTYRVMTAHLYEAIADGSALA